MVDRYQQIRAAEDLGGLEIFPDLTPDLRRTAKIPDRGVGAPAAVEDFARPTSH